MDKEEMENDTETKLAANTWSKTGVRGGRRHKKVAPAVGNFPTRIDVSSLDNSQGALSWTPSAKRQP
jgi:hypothetical protein